MRHPGILEPTLKDQPRRSPHFPQESPLSSPHPHHAAIPWINVVTNSTTFGFEHGFARSGGFVDLGKGDAVVLKDVVGEEVEALGELFV